jgi:chromosome segregation protein
MTDGQRAANAARTVRQAGERGTRFVWNTGNGSGNGSGAAAPGDGAVAKMPPLDPRILRPLTEAVLDTGPRAEVLGRLVRRTLVARDLGAALELHQELPEWNFVTPLGEMVHADGVLEDGTDRSWGAFSLESELAGLEREEQELCGRRDELRREIASLGVTLKERDSRIEALARTESEIEKRELSIRLERDARQAESAKIARRRGALEAQRCDLETGRKRIETENRQLDERRQQVGAKRVGLEQDQERLRAELLDRQEALETVRSRYQESCSRRDALEAEHRAAESEVGKLRRREEDLLNRCDATETEIDTLGRRQDETEIGEERTRIEIHRLEERIGTMAAERGEIEAGLEAVRGGVVEKKEPIRAARREREAALSELREAELSRTRLDSDLEHLLASCREELGCGPEEIPVPEPGSVPPLPESEREVEELKEKLQRVGPVNLVAVEELEKLEERQAFLTGQRQDLLDAIASLRNTIQRLNRESRERFVVAFEEIRERFQGTFEKLFGGGQAQLRLEESDDPLLAGVEIIAQPPGKRLQSIRLLSGGEKALTAIALLFSVFQYRPSPFCVLDEVDAPLDEANVERFSRMLRHLKDETQFILITHSRRSMENADSLYGVTMEESGISKVMSLQFEQERDH